MFKKPFYIKKKMLIVSTIKLLDSFDSESNQNRSIPKVTKLKL